MKILGYNINISAKAKPPAVQQSQVSNKTSPSFIISKIQLERIRHDMKLWRDACIEAENPYFPQRVRMQRMYLDTILNEHLKSCIRRRKSLTYQRKFKLVNDAGAEDKETVKLFQKPWFRKFQSYSIDALFYGYNLIQLNDIINDGFPKLKFVKREIISPDRRIVGTVPYAINGQKFDDPKFKDWYIFIDTPTDTGASDCGYGLLYELAKTEILLRSNTGQNADYNETFGQPIRKGTTTKQKEERDEFEKSLQNMGSNAWILLDEVTDKLELIESSSRGSAYLTYDNLEKRLEAKISKVILGHADALDSVPGKLGAGTGEDNPVEKALSGIQSEDAEFLQPIINEELIPRMRIHGFNIPEGFHFEFINDEEKEAFRAREDKSNKVTAEIAQTMKNAGLQMDPEYFEERTGIPTTKIEIQTPPATGINDDKAIAITKQIEKMKPEEKLRLNGKAKQLK